jgi:hypothetical protein
MSKEGTKLNAAEAAKKAEEAIRNAELLEQIARDAVNAAAQAREEAEQAKSLAKATSKKKNKVETTKSKDDLTKSPVDKKFILDYIQNNALDLYGKMNNLLDIRFEDDPPRVVMVVMPVPGGLSTKAPELVHNGVKLEVEVEFRKPTSVMLGENESTENSIITEDENSKNEDEIYHRSITGKAAEILGITEALGPHSLDKAAKQRESYEAWVKRHPAIKVRNDG